MPWNPDRETTSPGSTFPDANGDGIPDAHRPKPRPLTAHEVQEMVRRANPLITFFMQMEDQDRGSMFIGLGGDLHRDKAQQLIELMSHPEVEKAVVAAWHSNGWRLSWTSSFPAIELSKLLELDNSHRCRDEHLRCIDEPLNGRPSRDEDDQLRDGSIRGG